MTSFAKIRIAFFFCIGCSNHSGDRKKVKFCCVTPVCETGLTWSCYCYTVQAGRTNQPQFIPSIQSKMADRNNGAVGLLKFVSKVRCHKLQQNFHHVTVAKVLYLLGFWSSFYHHWSVFNSSQRTLRILAFDQEKGEKSHE